MAIGAGQGVLTALNATHIESCIDEFKVVYCDAMDAYSSVMVDKKLGPAIGALLKASNDFSKAMTDC